MQILTPASPPGARPASNAAGWLAAVGSAAAFSVAAPIASKLIGWGMNPSTILVLRLWLGVALLFGTLALAAPGKLRLARRLLPVVAVAGVAMGAAILLYFWSLTRLDTSIASMLVALEPLMVLMLLRLRGERFTYRNTIRLALGLGGVYLLVGVQGGADWLGLLMVVGTVLGSAFQTVALQWFFAGQDGRTITAYIVLVMALTVSAVWAVQAPAWHSLGWAEWAGIAALALVPTYLARLGLFAAVQRLGGGQVALLAPLETLLTVIWSITFLGDRLSAGAARRRRADPVQRGAGRAEAPAGEGGGGRKRVRRSRRAPRSIDPRSTFLQALRHRRPDAVNQLLLLGGGEVGGRVLQRVVPRRHTAVLDVADDFVGGVFAAAVRLGVGPVGKVQMLAAFPYVLRHQPRHRRNFGVPGPGGLVAVAVEARPLGQRAGLRAVPIGLGYHRGVGGRNASGYELDQAKEHYRGNHNNDNDLQYLLHVALA